ncbi:response regulator [Dulcicalothrix desertica PCC 7102]|uniref:Response regulator n=1 Tax=Dulcicalothrix desertica PCC 7102 TaxID=232991 RepID=A0A433VPA1_9CYAN|nr:response regulator [Dulcicalothrix desertica]RUT07865.1 response regulator [Dulcicalothrix desertica PCC 7102]TWH39386.1 twitching motility two-component system response regulator PilH [Dulcicalothrix desertica PCC 7102]BDA75317.1 response regulator receiver protein [Calothrix sp. PCC 7716]GJD18534.1 response regulator receiver protein [Rivularia sp. IAM M-261]
MTTLLVVDDTPSQLELINCYLEDGGYNVIKAYDAKEGFKKALNDLPDIVITDIVMPGMSGFELCRLLKRNTATQNIRIIICSSKNGDIDKIWGMRQGADFYLTKPFGKQELLRAIQSLI